MDYIVGILPSLIAGTVTTLKLFIICIVLALPLGFIIMLAARCSFKPLSFLGSLYIYVLRGTPLLLQLYFIYFGLPLMPYIGKYLILKRFNAAIITFILNYAAYFAEIFRGGILSIDQGQYEASKVLGLSRAQTTFLVIIPQMLRVSLPSIANETVTLLKDTALIYAIAVPELLHSAKSAVNRDNRLMPLLVAGIIYLLLNALISFIMKRIEKKADYLGKGET